MIAAWLGAKGLFGLTRSLWIVLITALVLLGIGVVRIADNAVGDALDTAKQAGATEAVVAGHETTLDQLEEANEAGHEVSLGRSDAAYRQCLRDAAPGFAGNCERYNPDKLVPGRPQDAAAPRP